MELFKVSLPDVDHLDEGFMFQARLNRCRIGFGIPKVFRGCLLRSGYAICWSRRRKLIKGEQKKRNRDSEEGVPNSVNTDVISRVSSAQCPTASIARAWRRACSRDQPRDSRCQSQQTTALGLETTASHPQSSKLQYVDSLSFHLSLQMLLDT